MKQTIYKPILICLLTGLICSQALSQNVYLDSLKNELAHKKLPAGERMEILISLGNNIAISDQAAGRDYYETAYSIAKNGADNYYMASAMQGIAGIFLYNNVYDSAEYFLKIADSLFRKDASQESIASLASVKSDLAQIKLSLNNADSALQYYLDAIDVLEKSKVKKKYEALGNIFLSVGNVYQGLNQEAKALEYDRKGLEAHRKEKDNMLFIAYAELYVAGDYVNLNKKDSAQFHLASAKKMAKQIRSNDLFYELYSNMGMFYKKYNLYDSAIASYHEALSYAIKTGRKFREMDANRMIGFIYRDMKKYPESAIFLERALSIVRELKKGILEEGILKSLAKVYAALGNNKRSVKYYQEYIELSDSLNDAATKRKINEIENKYQAQKKQLAINELQKNNQIQKLELQHKNIINIALLSGCILLLLIGGLFYLNFKNKNRLLLQKEKLHTQQISEMEKERKLIAVQSVMKGQEEERSRLARDLHDGVGGLLSGIKLSMSTMKGNVFLSEENAQSFGNVIQQLDQSIVELRRVSHNMMPEALIKYGLKEALENYCENLNLSADKAGLPDKLKVQLQTYGMETRMDQNTEIIIYRMVQELLNNIIKHAGAKNVLIQLVRESERFNLTVEDDGKGFDINETKNGAGLANIKARAEYLDGSVDIVSKKGEGTSVNVEGKAEDGN